MPREGIEAEGSRFWLHGFGSGPYRLADWVRGVRMDFARSPAVNQPEEGFFERVDVFIGGDRALHAMMFERGELDAVYLVQIPDIVRFSRAGRAGEVLHNIAQASTDFLYMNTESPPFDQLKVRQAVSHAINRERLVTLTAHTAVVAKGILPPLMLGFNPAPHGLEFNPGKAKQLLREAGYPDGLAFELWYSDDDPRTGRVVVAIEGDLSAVGIRARLKRLTLPALLTATQTRRSAPCFYLSWSQDYPDPSNFLDVLFNGTRIQETGCNNFSFYNNPGVNRLLEQAERCAIPAERYRRYQAIENLILQDAPAVPLTHSATPMLISPRIGGFKPHPVWGLRCEDMWLEN